MGSVKAVDAHYGIHFGGEPEYWKFSDHPEMGGVLEWPKGVSLKPFHLYATLGLHGLVHGPLNHNHGFELYTCVAAGTDDVRLSFGLMANYVIAEQIVLEAGHVVTPAEERVLHGRDFRSWLMLERVDDFIPPLRLDNGHHVVFLDATPVFPEEARTVKEHGLDALFEVWDQDPPRLSDLNRELPRPLLA
ncbi:suppressor of fused domain protein [Arthrobacter sp. NQ7]|uniref:suppressor of fused domain protein n=1 Tax=Arthrobacter sp. NQ7 TaxID=3032303 RepID=UPI00240FE08C|nr:suppressor of fused domain protein [Arthrobacter sp. NQ7]MDJ0458494.1 suppressor of fused domain protein [Arthrobacter sp. NQ7]